MAAARAQVLALTACLAWGLVACDAQPRDPSRSPSPSSLPEPATVSAPATSGATPMAAIVVADEPADLVVDPGNELYTSDHGTVALVDLGRAEVGEFPQERVTVGTDSGGLALDAPAGVLYVASEDSRGRGTIAVLNVDRHVDPHTDRPRTFEVVDVIGLGRSRRPDDLALDPENDRLFALTGGKAVLVVDTRTRTVVGSVPVGYRASDGEERIALGMDVDPRAGAAIVTSTARIWVIDTKSLRTDVVDTVGGGPVTADPETGHAFVPNEADGTVTVVDTPRREVATTIRVGFDSSTGALAIDAKAGRGYLPVAQDGMLAVIDTKTLELVEKVPPPEGWHGWGEVEVDPSSGYLYAGVGGSVLVVTAP